MDPEAVKTLVDRALMRLGAEVARYGGTVDKYIGDNVMALFGAPLAHEDDAERAVRAGLGMQAAMAEVNAELPPGVHFDLRVGINTGEVLAGAVGESYTVTGDTVNVASRLQSAARPGSVTVGQRTMRATSNVVSTRSSSPCDLKGKAEPVAGLGGGAGRGRARRAPPGARPGVPTRGPRRGDRHARDPLRASGARGRAAPGDRSWARPAWASPACCASSSSWCARILEPAVPHRALPALRRRHRVLGAGRGAPRRVRDRGHRLR